MFVAAVHIEVLDGQLEAFLPLMKRQAADSVALEAGCLSFDVSVSADKSKVFLYETYACEADFDAHLLSAHFLRFKAATEQMIAGLDIHRFHLEHRV